MNIERLREIRASLLPETVLAEIVDAILEPDVKPTGMDQEIRTRRADELHAVEMQLAQRLFETMERLDPSLEICEWNDLRDRDKEIWRLCVDTLVEDGGSLKRALSLTDYDEISLGSKTTDNHAEFDGIPDPQALSEFVAQQAKDAR
jgi:hypothetical protein